MIVIINSQLVAARRLVAVVGYSLLRCEAAKTGIKLSFCTKKWCVPSIFMAVPIVQAEPGVLEIAVFDNTVEKGELN